MAVGLTLSQIQDYIGRDLAEMQDSFPQYTGLARQKCEALLLVDGQAYGLMTRVKILYLAHLCLLLPEAVEKGRSRMADDEEFEAKFGYRIGRAEEVMGLLDVLLTPQTLDSIKSSYPENEIKSFVRDMRENMTRLLFDLEYPYGKCVCAEPKAKGDGLLCHACQEKNGQVEPQRSEVGVVKAPVVEKALAATPAIPPKKLKLPQSSGDLLIDPEKASGKERYDKKHRQPKYYEQVEEGEEPASGNRKHGHGRNRGYEEE